MRSTTFSASRPNANAPLSRANQRVMGATTLRRRQMLQEKLSTVKNQLAQWMNGLLGYTNPEDEDEGRRPLTAETILERLSTGIALCELALRISPIASMAIPRINTKAKPYSILAHENVKYFVNACISFGVLRHELFEPNSLLNTNPDNRNEREVVFSILSLSRVALQKYNIQPPSMVMAEELIDQLDQLGDDDKDKSQSTDEPDSTGLSRSDDEKIREALEKFCRSQDIDVASIPTATDRRGQFRFSDGTNAHVRMFEAPNLDPEADGEGDTVSTLLVRYGNTWEDVLTFIAEHSDSAVGSGIASSTRARTTLTAGVSSTSGPLSVSQKLALAKQQRADEAEAAVKEAVKKAIEHAVQQVPPIKLSIQVVAPPQVPEEELAALRAAAAEAAVVKKTVALVEEKAKEAELKVEETQKQVEETQKQAEEAAQKQAEETQKLVEEAQKQAEESQKQVEDAKQEAQKIKKDAEVYAEESVAEIAKLKAQIEALQAQEAKREEEARAAEEARLAREAEDAAAEKAEAEEDDVNKIEISIADTTVDQLDDFDKRTLAAMNTKYDVNTMRGVGKRVRNGEAVSSDERRQWDKYNAKREFFFMTCLAVKMGHKLRDEAQIAHTEDLWEAACTQHVPFHKFVRWISKEITMRVFAADLEKSKPKAGISLRTFRNDKTTVMAQRKLTKVDNDDEFNL